MSVLLVCAGLWLVLPASSRRRLLTSRGPRSRLQAADWAALLAGVGVALLIGGLWGILLGAAAAAGSRMGLLRLSAQDPRVREELARQAPDAVDCLASCLAAGAPLWTSMGVVADAFGDPIAGVLRRCRARHALGATHAETFAEFLDDPALAPVGRVLLRSVESGAALTSALLSCAEQMRGDRGAELERRARAVGVRAVAPLAVCFLPAFVVLAVVPIIGSLVTGLF